jgi:hypothetical protein
VLLHDGVGWRLLGEDVPEIGVWLDCTRAHLLSDFLVGLTTSWVVGKQIVVS